MVNMTKSVINAYTYVKKFEKLILLLVFVLISIFILRYLLFSEMAIGFNHDWDWPNSVNQLEKFINNALYAWNIHNLGSSITFSSQYLLNFLIMPLSYLGISGLTIMKTLLLLVFVFSGYFMYLLMRESFNLGFIASFASGVFFMTSPVVFNRVVAGHILYLVGYALSPVVLLCFQRYVDRNRTLYLVLTGLLIAIAFMQIQFTVMLTILILLHAVLVAKVKIKRLVKIFLFFVIFVSLLHAFWILPFHLTGSNVLNQYGTSESAVENLKPWNTPIIDAFRMLGRNFFPYFSTALRGSGYEPIWGISSIVLVLLAFGSVLVSRNRFVSFLSILSIVVLMFTTSLSGPFGGVVLFAFSNFSVFNIFRELYHLTFLISFSYSVMLAFTIHSILSFKKLTFSKVVSVALLSIIILNNPIIYSGNFSNQVQQYKTNSEDIKVVNQYQQSNDCYRVLYLPMVHPFKYDNLSYYGIDPLIKYSEKPTIGNYITSEFLRRMAVTLYIPSKNVNPLLDLLGVKYVFFRKNYQSMLPNYLNQGQYKIGNRSIDIRSIWTNENLFNNINNQPNIKMINESENVIVFENINPLPYIYASVNPILIEGNIDEMMKVLEFTSISGTKSILFLSQQSGPQQLSSIPESIQTIPLQLTSITVCDDIIDWFSMYGNVSFLADVHDKREGNASLQACGVSDANGNFRFMYDLPGTWDLNEGTRLALWVKSNVTGWSFQRVIVRDVNGAARAWDFSITTDQWTELVLPLETYNYQDNGFNMSLIDRIEIGFEDGAKTNIDLAIKVDNIHLEVLKPKITSGLNDVVNYKATCTFTKENPTKYTVHVNASTPFFLIFSESYDAQWTAYLNGEEIKDHFMVNGYANAWYINKPGSYEIILAFRPQILFTIGVVISLATLAISLLYISQDAIKILYQKYTKKRGLSLDRIFLTTIK